MKGYSSREIIELIIADGWYKDRVVGDHWIFRHPVKKGIVVVPHPNKDLPRGTIRNIFKQAGINIEEQ